ncbi:MAG: hypothetical protein RL235_770 [Chlamydiota bacterium]|jgi:hypothetical protein
MHSLRRHTLTLTQQLIAHLGEMEEPWVFVDADQTLLFRQAALPSPPKPVSFVPLPPKPKPSPPPKIAAPIVEAPVYREGLKNWEMGKEAAANVQSGVSGRAREHATNEDETFAAKPTPPTTNFSVTSGIAPAPPKPKPTLHFDTMAKLLQKWAPSIKIAREPPSDAEAKRTAKRWQTKNQIAPITIVCGSAHAQYRPFLDDVADALSAYFMPAKVVDAEPIEKEKQWDTVLHDSTLHTVIVCDSTLWSMAELMRHYRENPTTGTRTIGTKPLVLLPDLTLYLKDHTLKKSLWKSLCQKFGSQK